MDREKLSNASHQREIVLRNCPDTGFGEILYNNVKVSEIAS